MSLWQTLQVAIAALYRTKTRSLLTVLGVIIGVAAVIAMVSIGEGAKARVAKTFESMGTNTLVISSGSSRTRGVRGGSGSQPTLTWDDLEAIRNQVTIISGVAPELRAGAQVMSEGENWQTSVTGTTPEWFEIRNWPLDSGELFTRADLSGGRKVAILGKTVVANLYGLDFDPVGQTVRINRIPFKVIGVAAAKGTSPFGSDNDDRVIIPATTFGSKISGGLQKYLQGQILVNTQSRAHTAQAKEEIEELLRERHRIRPGAEDDFFIRDPSEMADAQQESAQTITSLLAGVALVSLLVGGIGIMNIMLVSVTERTREIGLRMAVGAKPRHILLQFLIEAVVLSIAGGVFGIAAGIGAAQYMAARFDFPLLIRVDIVVLAVAVSALVGIGFGLYPARKASGLDPIQALRYE
jgi:putative ABC transport system permease protein